MTTVTAPPPPASRRSVLALPTVGTLALRTSQLLVLVAVARVAPTEVRSLVIAAMGVLSATTVFADSGAASYLLSLPGTSVARAAYRRAVAVQLLLAALGATAALVWVSTRATTEVPGQVWLVLAAVALAQAVEATSRAVRAPLLLGRDDAAFSRPELLLSLGKTAVVGVAWLSSELTVLLLVPVVALLVVVRTFVQVDRGCPSTGPGQDDGVRTVLQYGLAGSLSALYSQGPVLVAGALLSLDATALITVAYRVTQSLEILPGTVAMQVLPRVRTHLPRRAARAWADFVLLGLVLATVAVLLGPLVRLVLLVPVWDAAAFAVVAASLVVKSGNYFLVSLLMGRGGVRRRIVVTGAVGVGALTACSLVAPTWGLLGLAWVTVAGELALAGGLAAAVHTVRVRGDEG